MTDGKVDGNYGLALPVKMKNSDKMTMKSSDSAKEPSRTSTFVLGPSGQNFDFSFEPSFGLKVTRPSTGLARLNSFFMLHSVHIQCD